MEEIVKNALFSLFVALYIVEFVLVIYAYRRGIPFDWSIDSMLYQKSLTSIIAVRAIYMISVIKYVFHNFDNEITFVRLACIGLTFASCINIGNATIKYYKKRME